MNSAQTILIGVAVVGITVFGFMRSGENEYAEQVAALDSPEAKAALVIFKQLSQSTNALAGVISPKANPMVQQRLLRSANQLQTAGSVELTSAHWTGDYLKIQIKAAEELHWYTLEQVADDGLKLLGVQE